jgi:hypothetical protein
MKNLDKIYANLSLDARMEAIDEVLVEEILKQCKGEESVGDMHEQIGQIISTMPQDQFPQCRRIICEREERQEKLKPKLIALTELYYRQKMLELKRTFLQLNIKNAMKSFVLMKFISRPNPNEEIGKSDLIDADMVFGIENNLARDSHKWDKELDMSAWDGMEKLETDDICLFNGEKSKELSEIESKLKDLAEDEMADDARGNEIEEEISRLMTEKVELVPLSKKVLGMLEKLWEEREGILRELKKLIGGDEELLRRLEDGSRPLSEIIYSDIIDGVVKSADEHSYGLLNRVCDRLGSV